MSVIDIFSRFLFLRPLQTKETSEVAEHLLDIYIEHGPPEILQSDQGPEFKGVVRTVCEMMIKGELRRNPPSLYNKGETVLL